MIPFLTVLILFLLYLYVYVFFFFPYVVVKYDSYYGVLMAYGGLQDVRGSRHINLVNGELLFG